MATRIELVVLVLLLSVSLSAQQSNRRKPPKQPQPPASGTLSLKASEWTTISTPQRYPLLNDTTGALTFAFRPVPGSMGYLIHASPGKVLAGRLTVSLQVSTSGSAVVVATPEPGNTCQTPASVRVLIWANRNAWGSDDRWWSNPISAPLIANSMTLSVPLTPDQWSNVNGQFGTASPTGWASALANVSSLGLTFGSCFFGHGVSLSGFGSATFTLLRFAIEL